MLLVRLPYSTRQGDGIGCLGVRYYRLITIYYGLARAAPHRVPLQGYGMHHKGSWGCGQPLHTPPGWIYSPLEGLTNVDNQEINYQRLRCSTDNAVGSEYNCLHPFTPICGQALHSKAGRTRHAELTSAPAYKGIGSQEVIPDWLQDLTKRRLQSYFGIFRKEVASDHKL